MVNDAIYFAVALYKRCPIWSNDKLMAKQDRVKVISTKDLLAILGMPYFRLRYYR